MARERGGDLSDRLLKLVPEDGRTIPNAKLRDLLATAVGRKVTEVEYFQARDVLVEQGVLRKGAGRGGSVHRVIAAPAELVLQAREVKDDPSAPATRRVPGARPAPRAKGDDAGGVLAYRHADRRRNNPEVGMVDPDSDPDDAKTRWAYDPHLDPALQFDVGRAQVEKLIDDALESGDEAAMRATLVELKRLAEPYLNWTGKAERTSFEVDTVSLHVHERIDPATILGAVQKRIREGKREGANQQDWLRAWFETPLPYREAIEFWVWGWRAELGG